MWRANEADKQERDASHDDSVGREIGDKLRGEGGRGRTRCMGLGPGGLTNAVQWRAQASPLQPLVRLVLLVWIDASAEVVAELESRSAKGDSACERV